MYIATSLAQRHDLCDILTLTGEFRELDALVIFHQIMKGIQAIHESGYVNRDIKVENILID